MNIKTRKALDKSFSVAAYASLLAMCLTLALFLLPIIFNGVGAFFFNATVEHEKFLHENLNTESSSFDKLLKDSDNARAPLYQMMRDYENPTSAKFLKSQLDESLNESLALLESRKDEVVGILSDKDAKTRLAGIQQISAEIWKPYTTQISMLTAKSLKNENAIALKNIFKIHESENPNNVRAALQSLWSDTKVGVAQKSSFRRNFLEVSQTALANSIEKLESITAPYMAFKKGVTELLGPHSPAVKEKANLMRQKYGQTRMDQAHEVFGKSVLKINVAEKDSRGVETLKRVDSAEIFADTPVEKMLEHLTENFDIMLQPHWRFYPGFFFDDPYDSNIFGGIWPMIAGTFYLTVGAMIIAAPLGIIAAIYFSEYAGSGTFVSILRMCVGTLAGVPSIVFGLFGLAFLINTLKISESKSVLAGALTLALLILPTIIRACEEAIKSVPNSYREASLGLGAGKWKSITGVILPSALPGMLTGIIISMGRAAGETAPIIFTAATSTGAALAIWEVFSQATPALPWNIYNMCSEHEMADRVAHVQYGMVFTLIAIVLSLNLVAIVIRSRIQKKLSR